MENNKLFLLWQEPVHYLENKRRKIKNVSYLKIVEN